ncbi:stage II sporulation protein M [Cohnella soli]|uniref:Stage II sporulation protein M n=1 Tax=Cohnella soli TaxID=425005 RepID=A0ABW0HU24_9BACL
MQLRLWNLSARDNINLYVFVGVLVIVGAVFGGMLVHALTLEQQQEMADHLGAYLTTLKHPDQLSASDAFWGNFRFYAKWLLLIWLLGLSVIGLPFVFALDFLKGVLVGFAVALLAQQFEWKGVWFFIAATAPQNAIVVPALMIASISAARFAYFVVRERLFRRKGQLLPPFLAHTAVTGMMLIALVVASLVEAYVSPALVSRAAPSVSVSTASTIPAEF